MLFLILLINKTYMTQNHNKLDTQHEAKLIHQIKGGIRLADDAYPYLNTRGYYGLIRDISLKSISGEAKATATLMLSMSNMLQSVRDDKIDASISSAMHVAMGELIDNAYDTNISKSALVNACVRFCSKNGILRSGDDIHKLENEIMTNLTAVWHEHCWENLLLAAGVSVERANRGDDLFGTDLWVQLPDKSWVSIDIKTTPRTIVNHADRKGRQLLADCTFDAADSTAPGFTLYVTANSEGKSAYAAFDNAPASGGLAPIDFRNKSKAVNSARGAIGLLSDYANSGLTMRYRQVQSNSIISFVPGLREVER